MRKRNELEKMKMARNNEERRREELVTSTRKTISIFLKVREANSHFGRASAYKKKIEEEGARVGFSFPR